MRFFISLILNILLAFVTCLYLPWWIIAITAGFIAFIMNVRAGLSFLAAFTGIFVLWFVLSFYISIKNEHILAHKISLMILKSDSPVMLIIVTALIGAIVAGMGAITGSFMKTLIYGDPKKSIAADF